MFPVYSKGKFQDEIETKAAEKGRCGETGSVLAATGGVVRSNETGQGMFVRHPHALQGQKKGKIDIKTKHHKVIEIDKNEGDAC